MTREDIKSALEGDRAALRRLVEQLVPVIRVEVGVALSRQARIRRRDPRQEVDDFTQEMLVRLLADDGKLLRMWDPARGRSLASFVRLITRQRVSRALQRFKGNPWSAEPTEPSDFEYLGEAREAGRGEGTRVESRIELRSLLERLRAHLNERGLQLFQLIYVEQKPIREVCDELGMTRGAVDAWNSRTRKLARRLAQERAA